MANEKFNPKAVMEISKNSKVGALVFAESYEDFKKEIKTTGIVADMFGKVEKEIAQKLQAGKDVKAVVDGVTRQLKKADTQMRGFLAQYMIENNVIRFDGKNTKSITLQKPKVTKDVISTKQIKVKNKYVNIDDLTKDYLIEMLEEKGVKTRVQTKEVEAIKNASIRVQK